MDSLHLFSKYAICYGLFFLLTYISKLNKGHKLFDKVQVTGNRGILSGLQIAGILWLGIIPVAIIHHSFTTIVFGKQLPEMNKFLTLFILLISTVIIAAKLSELSWHEMRKSNTFTVFSNVFIYRYCILRIIFLAAYEIFFRGYLLTDCITRLGIGWAIALNVFLYTLLHAVSDRREILACIPFGILLCAISIWFAAAWPAIVIHIVFSIIYEFKLMRKFSNPSTAAI